MSINIRRDNHDPFYRYKMPPIASKIEGRGNGIKTAVVNLSDVARALARPSTYIIKWFGFELGAQTSASEETDRYIVNGAHDAGKLQDSLDGFINKFVLCGNCKNPETDFVFHRDGTVEKDCKACGAKSLVDPRHKLTGFIAKNPPQATKQKKKPMANAGASTGYDDADGADEGKMQASGEDELTRRINAEAANLPAMAAHTSKEDEWSADVSEEAVKARQKKLEKTMGALGLDDTTSDEVYDEFGTWIISEKPSDIEIYKRAVELGISDKPKAVQVLAQALFTTEIVKEIAEHAGLLSKMVSSEEHERALLGGFERFVGLEHPQLVAQVPNILFKLYEGDIISEEVVEHWGTHVSKKYVDKDTCKKVRKAAKPFIEWLAQADSSEEEEEDSE